MRVAAVQFKPDKAEPQRSLARLLPLVAEAAAGSDLVVLPEMATTGYVFDSAAEIAPLAEAPRGRTYAALSPLARQHRTFIVAGYVERGVDDRLYNGALVIDRDGELAFAYRKTLLFDADYAWATPGDSGYRAFDTGAGTFGVGICMDLNDDGFLDWLAASRVRAVAFPTNWLEQHIDVHAYWRLRLRQAGSPALIAGNTWGHDRDIEFCGRSAIVDRGAVVTSAAREGDAVLRAALI